MYKYMYIILNGFYFFKYLEYNFITIVYLYSAIVGRLTGIREEFETGSERGSMCEFDRESMVVQSSKQASPAEGGGLCALCPPLADRLTNNLFCLPKHFFYPFPDSASMMCVSLTISKLVS